MRSYDYLASEEIFERISRWSLTDGTWNYTVRVCLPVSLAFMSGMHVFPRGHPMPVGQACLGGAFSVFEIQPLLLNLGPMFVHCLKLCQLPGRPWPPPHLGSHCSSSWAGHPPADSKAKKSLPSIHPTFHMPGSYLLGNSSPLASPEKF